MKKDKSLPLSINELLRKDGIISIRDFQEAMPEVSRQTVHNRIRAMVDNGIIHSTGRGLYERGVRSDFMIEISPWMKEINDDVITYCPELNFCLQERGGNLIIEVDKSNIALVVSRLREHHKNVVEYKDCKIALDNLTGLIAVRKLESEAPVIDCGGVRVPSLEKTLVDNVAEHIDDSNIQRIFQRYFETSTINRSSLIRYASRRNVADKVSRLLAGLSNERIYVIRKIQDYFRSQPVERVWLFGSYSRGEENPDSDIDILVDFSESDKLSLLDMSRMTVKLKDIVGREIDLVENGSLMPFAVKSAERDKYLIYERKV